MYTDEQLAVKIAAGETELLGEIIDRYETKLSRYLHRMMRSTDDVNDLLQEIFIKCFVHIKSFHPDKKFSSWIYRIAHNEAINLMRKKKAIPFSLLGTRDEINTPIEHMISDTIDIEHDHIQRQDASFVAKIISELPENHREVLVLYFYQELSYAEISDVLRIPVSSVGVKISRAKELLKKHLGHLY